MQFSAKSGYVYHAITWIGDDYKPYGIEAGFFINVESVGNEINYLGDCHRVIGFRNENGFEILLHREEVAVDLRSQPVRSTRRSSAHIPLDFHSVAFAPLSKRIFREVLKSVKIEEFCFNQMHQVLVYEYQSVMKKIDDFEQLKEEKISLEGKLSESDRNLTSSLSREREHRSEILALNEKLNKPKKEKKVLRPKKSQEAALATRNAELERQLAMLTSENASLKSDLMKSQETKKRKIEHLEGEEEIPSKKKARPGENDPLVDSSRALVVKTSEAVLHNKSQLSTAKFEYTFFPN